MPSQPLWMLAASAFAVAACSASEPYALDDSPASEGAEAGGSQPNDFLPDVEPDLIIAGISYDSDTDVRLINSYTNPLSCSGTMLRNNIMLTARHCVTMDGYQDGPLATNLDFLLAVQDGAGDSYKDIAWVEEVVDISPAVDVALVLLEDSGLVIDGALYGESTEILTRADSELVGRDMACAGYGLVDCESLYLQAWLKLGIVTVQEITPAGMIYVIPYLNSPWMPSPGDSGGSCRISPGDGLDWRHAGVISQGYACAPSGAQSDDARLVRPSDFRSWAQAQVVEWSGEYFSDDYAVATVHVDIIEPADDASSGITTSWLVVANRLWQVGIGYVNDPQTQEGTKYIYEDEVVEDGAVRAVVTGGSTTAAGLVLRVRDEDQYYRFSVDVQAEVASIVLRDGDTFEVLQTASVPGVDFTNSPELEFRAEGNVLRGFVNGEQVLMTVDPDYTYLAGRAGLYSYDTIIAVFNDFEIQRACDGCPPL